MNRKIISLLIVFLIFPCTAYSITTFVIQETEKISLVPNATDPDADNLITTYSPPLDKKGEWQTKYGDAGEYKAAITVSDRETSASEDVLIIVNKKEEKPRIDSFSPAGEYLKIEEGSSIEFKISASDLNKDKLAYEWLLDGKKVSEAQNLVYETDYTDAGSHEIAASVTDGISTISQKWNVEVNNVDVEGLIEGIQDAAFDENEIASLRLPNFKKLGLDYSISEPIGNDNEWKTGFKDAGNYETKVHVEGKGIDKDKTVKLEIRNVDRAPEFEELKNIAANEGEEVKIVLNAKDTDGDGIKYSAENMPRGSKLEDNLFTWQTDFDTVKKEDFVDRVMDKFRSLAKSHYIRFLASSNGKTTVKNVIVTVKDVNRAPVLEDIEPITINEGGVLRITPNAYDPDGDKISFKYSGFMDKETYQTTYDDAGTHTVKITASDGNLEATKSVEINVRQTNRNPVFRKMKDIKANEGDSIAILLDAYDPDGDEISYSIDNAPEGSSIKGNAFLWTPDFSAVQKGTKKIGLVFAANDGKAETKQIISAEIKNKNRAPRIIDATKSISAKANKPVLLFVKADDDDGDELSYKWEFGLLEKYKATSSHKRIFSSGGAKTVKVTVSDGIDSVEQTINVNVV